MNTLISRSFLIIMIILSLAACGGPETMTPDPAPADGGEVQEEVPVEEDPVVPEIDPEAIYATRCARCHAADRSGNNGPALLPDNLTKDPSTYVATITNGSGPMPSFGNRLSAEEISAIVEFILSEPQ